MTIPGVTRTADAGLFGKLPARGDFVQLGLPGSFVRPWDAWLQQVMAASQERMGDAWLPAFLESPVWRFVLPAGMCGPGAALGLWMPSVDRVGRYFPLTLAAVVLPGGHVPRSDQAESWLDACETAGRAALDEDATPDQVAQRLPPLAPDATAERPGAGTWWTVGGPRVPATRLTLAALPNSVQFAAMLGWGLDAGVDDGLAGVGDRLAGGRDVGPGTGLDAGHGVGLGDQLDGGPNTAAPAQEEA